MHGAPAHNKLQFLGISLHILFTILLLSIESITGEHIEHTSYNKHEKYTHIYISMCNCNIHIQHICTGDVQHFVQ